MDNSDALSDLYKLHRAGQDKYTYFLLAAAGAAVAFAVTKTEGLTLSWWLVPVGLAILSWGCSFYCGCTNVLFVQGAVAANTTLLKLRMGSHPMQPTTTAQMNIALEVTQKGMATNIDKAAAHGQWQFRFLVAGAVLFIGWRVAEMIHLTYF